MAISFAFDNTFATSDGLDNAACFDFGTAAFDADVWFAWTATLDGTATLSYKRPSFVFAPYMEEGGQALETLAAELDARFASIAENAAD